ncbi:YraN family protein [Acrocarpospora catenulata]|uniref:YraN family protein n=1 Tax=Acrocarpospora catenulata TaxID=2836182 RepID=UPI001BD99065|nr:YraN family protein [Acrocarpospora catenulata]
MAAKDELGKTGERIAVEFLQAAGMRVLDRNWRCGAGEIDIVARDGRVLVVVEVRTRSGRSHGTALESVTQEKLLRLRSLAGRWLATQQEWFDAIRVDVVALERFAGDFSIRHERGLV